MTDARAAVLLGKDKVEIWNVKVHDPEPGGALIEVLVGGVCGTDVHMFRGLGSQGYPLPIILGHEGVGRLAKLGAGISTDFASQPVKPGDLVYWSPKKACGRCYTCTVLDDSPCEHSIFCGPAREPNWATHQEFACLPPGMPFFKVPAGASLDAVISLGCALPTALRGIDISGPIKIGETVVVQGAGPVGLAAVVVAKTAGAREIIVIDQHRNRLESAQRLGATATISLDQSAEERKRAILELCGRQGPNVVVEATGFLPAFPEGVDLTGMCGRYVVVGLFGAIGTSAIPPRALPLKNLRIQGAMSPKPKHYYQALHLAARMEKELPLADLVTHRFSLDREVEALKAVEEGHVIKAVIDLQKS